MTSDSARESVSIRTDFKRSQRYSSVSPKMTKIVHITVEGGVIQDVQVPDGVAVIVRDYDVDGAEEGLPQDENGDEFIESVWE